MLVIDSVASNVANGLLENRRHAIERQDVLNLNIGFSLQVLLRPARWLSPLFEPVSVTLLFTP